jgi:LmbE family N-acetylglucosaminyl deacetylase
LSLKLVRGTALLGLLLPFLYFGTASGTFLYRLHAENSARSSVKLALCPAPTAQQRIVIFSPHPDDETLGCGGLIRQAERAGAAVRVVMLTNGDGFRVAVERQFRELRVEPEDYVRFADLRQQESCRALAGLGLRRENIVFLGYPDRGLLPLWNDHWSPDNPYVSPYTRRDRSPYRTVFRPNVVYCGQNVLADVKAILRDARPTDVYVTHPSDDHPDHSAAGTFVTLALQQFRQEGAEWAQDCRLRYYLVHRGDWPVPQGLYRDEPLVPPGEMASLDTEWRALPLTEEDAGRKTRSILAYSSQTSVMKRFLVSFARRNELFGELRAAAAPRVPDGAVAPDGSAEEWRGVKAAVMDPVNDTLLRDFQGGGDVKAVYACHDATDLYLRIDTYQPVSDRVEFTLRFRYFGDAARGAAGGSYIATLRPPRAVSPPGLSSAVSANRLEMAIPLRDLGYARRLALNVETRFAGIQVDRTGYRFLKLTEN